MVKNVFFKLKITLLICIGGTTNISIGGRDYSVVVHELEPGSSYRFWMTPEAEGGPGPSTEPLYTTIPISGM